jgi:hypothetical protein
MADKKPKVEESAVVEEVKIHTMRTKEKNSKWSLERCQKVAKRFESVSAWQAGAPSAFKSAQAHGWVEQCSSHMRATKGTLKRSA